MKTNRLLFVLSFLTSSSILLTTRAQTLHYGKPDSVQLQNHRYIELYRSSTDMSYLSPKGEIGAPTKYVLNGELVTNFFLLASRNARLAVAVTPRFMVRIQDSASAPVRTPSYRIGVRVFYRLSTDVIHFKYLEGHLYHHSNGQSGDVFRADGSYNTENGDFTTNYLEGDYHWGTYHRNRYATNYGVGVQWHAPFFNHSEGLKDHYGFTRLQGQVIYRLFRKSVFETTTLHKSSLTAEFLRITAQLSYAINQLDGFNSLNARKRVNAELTIYYIPIFSRDTGLFATAGYYGEDPYNISFNQHYVFLRLGISFGYTRYDEDLRK